MKTELISETREEELLAEIQRLCDIINAQYFAMTKQITAIRTASLYANFEQCPDVKKMLDDTLEQK